MLTADIKQAFLDFFKSHGHTVVPSASLIPATDPSLLFNNAGMVPFKPYFLGLETPVAKAVTSAQRCLRVGGKHNDLDQVGFTARHLTLFEMLGNFSFGAYGKEEAIAMAWTFLTKVLGLSQDKLWVTVYQNDQEASTIWHEQQHIPKERILTCGDADNFWSMGDTGPCGPCSEIFFDRGSQYSGGLPGTPNQEGDRYVEIWNLVFMEHDRQANGDLQPLPQTCIDTGMGLERIAMVMQASKDVFDTDTMKQMRLAIDSLAQKHQATPSCNIKKVIADHIRAISWLIVDQVRPSNEGRGYVLRRVIRRALRYAYISGFKLPCLYQLIPIMARIYADEPQLIKSISTIKQVLKIEEEAFARTLISGMQVLEKHCESLTDTIPGETVFMMYDTYGFPVDLVEDLAKEKGLMVDKLGFEKAMAIQRQRSKKHQKFQGMSDSTSLKHYQTDFIGFQRHQGQAKIVAIYDDKHHSIQTLSPGQTGSLILDQTVFYAEAGGQMGDQGIIELNDRCFKVRDTQKLGGNILHLGSLDHGCLQVGDSVDMQIWSDRINIQRNHTATHLLHHALQQVLGQHVVQKGSIVTADKLRFDFSHHQAIKQDQWLSVETLVNQIILNNLPVTTQIMAIDKAKQEGAMALFSEKYDEQVRVVSVGDVSKELCGGTHVSRSGDIGCFLLTQESAVAQGVRRIEAITGLCAIKHVQSLRQSMQQMAAAQGTSIDKLPEKIKQLGKNLKELKAEIQQHRSQQVHQQAKQWCEHPVTIVNDTTCVLKWVSCEPATLRTAVEACLVIQPNAVVVLCLDMKDQQVMIAVGVPPSLAKTHDAKVIIQKLSQLIRGRGGGKNTYAQMVGQYKTKSSRLLADIQSVLSTN